MTKIKAKYPIKVGGPDGNLIPKGEIGKLIKLEESTKIKNYFPAIKENPTSDYCLVRFPIVGEFICLSKQIEKIEDE